MRFSDNKSNIISAFANCRRLVVAPKKSKQNTHLKNHYATLDDVNKAIAAALEDSGLIVVQSPTHEENQPANVLLMETTIIHAESGEWMADVCQIPLAKNDSQGFGSALTYARRYAKVAIFDLSMSDDDGQKSVVTAADFKKRIVASDDLQEIDHIVKSAAERFANDNGSLTVIRDAAVKRRTELSMKGAKPFNPSQPQNARRAQGNAAPDAQEPPKSSDESDNLPSGDVSEEF